MAAAPAAAAEPSLASWLWQWLEDAPRMIGARRLEQAQQHAQTLALEIDALRLGHIQSVDRASQALDGMLGAARTAIEVVHGELPGLDALQARSHTGLAWFEPTLALQRNFELQARAWNRGELPRQDFMRGHETLVQHTLQALARQLDVAAPRDDERDDARDWAARMAMIPAMDTPSAAHRGA